MLPEPSHVWSVFSRLESAPPPRLASNAKRLFIDSSTIDIATSLSTAELIANTPALNGTFVDAPVSGGVAGATAGTLTFMLGCHSSLLSRVNGVLSLMGSRVFHCGKPGDGLAAKLTNNYLLAISNIATAEAMNMGLKLGLDKDILKNVINSSSGKCWSSDVNNPVDNALKGFEGGFAVALMRKDLALAMRAARENGAKLTMAERAESVYNDLSREAGQKDFSIVFKWLQEASRG
jgi:3-hydroxyisobutyrate dehydrogenase-like beta-hydroxyacid dehydrogenase